MRKLWTCILMTIRLGSREHPSTPMDMTGGPAAATKRTTKDSTRSRLRVHRRMGQMEEMASESERVVTAVAAERTETAATAATAK